MVTTIAVLTIVAVAVPARQVLAAGDDGSPAPAPDTARVAPTPGSTRFVTSGGETVEGQIIDRLPNGYLVRLANGRTRVVVYEDVASIEGPAAPPPPSIAPAPYPVQPGSPATEVIPPALTPSMPAEAPERFGRSGQIIMQQGFGFVSHSDSSTTIVVSLAFDFLVTSMLTVGFDVGYSRTKLTVRTGTGTSSTTTTSSDAQGLLNVGLVARVSDVASLWPRLGAGIARDLDGPGANSAVVGGQLQLLLHPARHFFVALGPVVRGYRSTEGSGQKFHYTEGFDTGVGGWW